MTTAEAAEALGIHRSRVLHLIREGRLPAVKHGRDWWIEPEAIAAFAAQDRKPGRPRKAEKGGKE
jgi:excisionase family DNA binding protein